MFGIAEQKKVLWLLLGGLGIMSCGCCSGFFVSAGATGNSFAGNLFLILFGMISLFGLGLTIWGGVLAFQNSYGNSATKPMRVEHGVYIMNILILNRDGDHVFDPEMYPPEELKYIVQIALASGQRIELETHPLVVQTMGEGMRGTVTYQGNWLSKFEREIGR